MFSQELENLIQATLEDGILEDYEKAALMKRAQAEGVDLAELEIYINSILQRRRKEQNQKEDARQTAIDQKKKEELGRICPKCGKQIPPMTVKCDCGYEVISKKSTSSVQILSEKIDAIRSLPFTSSDKDEEIKQRDEQIRELISIFPVPNTKEDIIDFLALAAPNSRTKGGIFGTVGKRLMILLPLAIVASIITLVLAHGNKNDDLFFLVTFLGIAGAIICSFVVDKETLKWNKNAVVWKSKFDQVLIKGRSLRGDSEFIQQLNYYENLFKNK